MDTPCSSENIGPQEICLPSDELINTCNTDFAFWGEDAPDMVENFMSYHFSCQKMFTKGQKQRMKQYIIDNYASILNNIHYECSSELNVNVMVNLKTNVFPNPSNNFIEISGCEGFFEIVSSQGRKVKTFKIDLINNVVDISEIEPGTYFLIHEQRFMSKLIIENY
jgi:hypothetical protein